MARYLTTRLLLMILLFFIFLARYGEIATFRQWAARQAEAVQAIVEAGGEVRYDYQTSATGQLNPKAEPPGPVWLRWLAGDDCFRDVVDAYVMSDHAMEYVGRLTKLRSLTCRCVTDAGLAPLREVPRLSVFKKRAHYR
jgi:hypothetical protein